MVLAQQMIPSTWTAQTLCFQPPSPLHSFTLLSLFFHTFTVLALGAGPLSSFNINPHNLGTCFASRIFFCGLLHLQASHTLCHVSASLPPSYLLRWNLRELF
ncbi:hypothetical protein C8R44DRAFT_766097 [Mycena epipterygia]|nr:hypothetical protein C8R44DRAFT_766097 [Mycena epipterygia]